MTPAFRRGCLPLVALLLPACGVLDDAPSCDAESFAPQCVSDSTLRSCVGGRQVDETCEAAELCAEPASWTMEAACFPAGELTCDPELEPYRCYDTDTIGVCDVDGRLSLITCDPDTTCQTSPVRAACAPPTAQSCDPQTFVNRCEGDSVARCDTSFGFVTLDLPCEEVCGESAKGAFCVGQSEIPCDPATFDTTCDDDDRVTCSSRTGFTDHWPCDADEKCRASFWSATCFDVNTPDCDPETFTRHCVGDALVRCTAYGVEESGCETGTVCRDSLAGSSCADPDADLCPYDFCADVAGWCKPAESVCDGDGYTFCIMGFLATQACAGDDVCVSDQWQNGAGEVNVTSTCIPPGTPACDDSQPGYCDDASFVDCVGGYEQENPCTENTTCFSEAYAWLCLGSEFDDCDHDTFVDHCDDQSVTFCFGDSTAAKLIDWPCPAEMTCVEAADGPECQAI